MHEQTTKHCLSYVLWLLQHCVDNKVDPSAGLAARETCPVLWLSTAVAEPALTPRLRCTIRTSFSDCELQMNWLYSLSAVLSRSRLQISRPLTFCRFKCRWTGYSQFFAVPWMLTADKLAIRSYFAVRWMFNCRRNGLTDHSQSVVPRILTSDEMAIRSSFLFQCWMLTADELAIHCPPSLYDHLNCKIKN